MVNKTKTSGLEGVAWLTPPLRLLTERFIVVGSVMFGATFNLVKRVRLP